MNPGHYYSGISLGGGYIVITVFCRARQVVHTRVPDKQITGIFNVKTNTKPRWGLTVERGRVTQPSGYRDRFPDEVNLR